MSKRDRPALKLPKFKAEGLKHPTALELMACIVPDEGGVERRRLEFSNQRVSGPSKVKIGGSGQDLALVPVFTSSSLSAFLLFPGEKAESTVEGITGTTRLVLSRRSQSKLYPRMDQKEARKGGIHVHQTLSVRGTE